MWALARVQWVKAACAVSKRVRLARRDQRAQTLSVLPIPLCVNMAALVKRQMVHRVANGTHVRAQVVTMAQTVRLLAELERIPLTATVKWPAARLVTLGTSATQQVCLLATHANPVQSRML